MESELLALLQNAKPNRDKLDELIKVLEAAASIDLSDAQQQQQLEGVWELRWSSSKQPYLQVQPWLENLQVLMPSQGRGMNLLRLPPPLAAAGVAVEAELSLEPPNGFRCGFCRGGLLGPQLAGWKAKLMTEASSKASRPGWISPPSAMSCAFAGGKTARCSPCASAMILMLPPCCLESTRPARAQQRRMAWTVHPA